MQGWRLEVPSLPRLAEIGSVRGTPPSIIPLPSHNSSSSSATTASQQDDSSQQQQQEQQQMQEDSPQQQQPAYAGVQCRRLLLFLAGTIAVLMWPLWWRMQLSAALKLCLR